MTLCVKRLICILSIFITCSSAAVKSVSANENELGVREVLENMGQFAGWNPGIPGGIPTVDTIYTTIPPGANVFVINAAIQSAGDIATRENPQVVQLSAGIYDIGERAIILNRSYVVLRGMGAMTIIRGHNVGQGAILIGPTMVTYTSPYAQPIDVVGDVNVNDTSITLTDASGFSPGDILMLDRLANDAYMNVASEEAIAAGGREFNNTGGSGDHDQFMRITDRTTIHGPRSANGLRLVQQIIEVERIEGNTIHLTNTINIDFPQTGAGGKDLNPQVWNTFANQHQFIGLEDVKLQITARSGSSANPNLDSFAWNPPAIKMQLMSSYSWVRNVWSDGTWFDETGRGFMGKHIEVHGFRNHVTGSAFIGSSQNGSGGNGYGIRQMGTDCLIDNNIVDLLCRPILGQNTGGGNVLAFNYVPNAFPTTWNNGNFFIASTRPPLRDFTQPVDSWVQDALNTSHGSFSHSDLFEGNISANITTDAVWGNSGSMVFFRNHTRGTNAMPHPDFPRWIQPLGGIRLGGWMTEHFSIGNVLLSPEVVDMYADTNPQVWAKPDDIAAYSRLVAYRFGNNNTVGDRFSYENFFWAHDFNYISNELLSRESGWSAPSANLPNSLFLTSAPDYFDGFVWPPINPLASSHEDRVNMLPAQYRYMQMLNRTGDFAYTAEDIVENIDSCENADTDTPQADEPVSTDSIATVETDNNDRTSRPSWHIIIPVYTGVIVALGLTGWALYKRNKKK